jgi:hypothetical protein
MRFSRISKCLDVFATMKISLKMKISVKTKCREILYSAKMRKTFSFQPKFRTSETSSTALYNYRVRAVLTARFLKQR